MAEPQTLRQRERELAVRAKREEEAREARKRRIIKSGGQVLETYRGPDTVSGMVYSGLGGLSSLFSRLTGSSERAAAQAGSRTENAARGLVEGLIGPEELERSVYRIAKGRGTGGDYALAALSAAPVPAPIRRGTKSLAAKVTRSAKGAASKVADTRLGRYLTESRAVPETRPAYERATEGPFTVIRRRDAAPQPVPAAQTETSLAALRRLAQDRDSSPAIRAADEAAMEARGVPYDERAPLPISSLQRQAAMGRAYREALSDNPAYKHALFERYGEMMPEVVEQAAAQNYDQLTEAAYRQLGEEVTQQFDRLPLTFRYHEGPGEYGSSTEMIQDALGRGNLNVFSGGEPHEFLSKVDPATGLSQNEMFRAVHDYMGHVVPASRFGPSGEEIAYAAHSQQLSPLAQLALLAETRGQNSLVNYSPLNADLIGQMNALRAQRKERKAIEGWMARTDVGSSDEYNGIPLRSILDTMPTVPEIDARLRELGAQTQYAPQRALLLPPEFVDPMSPGGMPEWARRTMRPSVPVSERGVHISKSADLTETDPSYYGRANKGWDYPVSRRHNLPDRTYFYTGPEGMVEKEGIINGPAYEASLHNLYDINADPEGLMALSRAYNAPYTPALPEQAENLLYAMKAEDISPGTVVPDMERLVRDYGYSGYLSDFFPHSMGGMQRAAAVFEPVTGLRRIEPRGQRYAEGGAVQADGNSA